MVMCSAAQLFCVPLDRDWSLNISCYPLHPPLFGRTQFRITTAVCRRHTRVHSRVAVQSAVVFDQHNKVDHFEKCTAIIHTSGFNSTDYYIQNATKSAAILFTAIESMMFWSLQFSDAAINHEECLDCLTHIGKVCHDRYCHIRASAVSRLNTWRRLQNRRLNQRRIKIRLLQWYLMSLARPTIHVKLYWTIERYTGSNTLHQRFKIDTCMLPTKHGVTF